MRGSWSGVPAPLGALVGRAVERAALRKAVARGERLITLVGPAGIGKTSLLLAFLSEERDALARQVGAARFCDLSAARTADDLGAAVLRALGARAAEGQPPAAPAGAKVESAAVEQAARLLASRAPLLLALDDFDALAGSAAGVIARWRAAAPALRILVTSRERLRTPGEACIEVASLAVPRAKERDLARIGGTDAVRLFVQRATAVRGDFVLHEGNARDVAAIVRRLDGVPLAIELCAARVGMLGIGQLREQLERSLDVLASQARPVAPRRASLRAALEWSIDLLAPWEREALAQCATFRGGFTLPAAEAVVDVSHHREAPTVLDVLQALHDKSLLATYEPEELPGERRYRLLEAVRELAAERLRASGAAREREAWARHARYFAAAGREHARLAATMDAVAAGRWLSLESENLLAAARRLLGEDQAPGSGARRGRGRGKARRARPAAPGAARTAAEALLAVEPVMVWRGVLGEYAGLLDSAIARLPARGPDRTLRARLRVIRGQIHILGGEVDAACASFQRARADAIGTRDPTLRAFVAAKLAAALALYDRWREALPILAEAERCARRARDPRVEAIVLTDVATARAREGRLEEAAEGRARAARIFERIGDVQREAIALSYLAAAEIDLERWPDARRDAERALALARAVGSHRIEARSLARLGRIDHRTGSPARARERLDQALALQRELGETLQQAWTLGALGDLAMSAQRWEEAAERYDEAVRIAESAGEVHNRALRLATAAVAEAHLGRGTRAEARLDAAAELRPALRDAAILRAIDVARDVVSTLAAPGAAPAGAREESGRGRSGRARSRRGAAEAAVRASDDVRFLEELRAAARRSVPARDPGARKARRREARALVLGPDAWWFVHGGERVDLLRHRAARLVLRALAEARRQTPGRALGLDALFEAGWPGERVLAAARHNRVYVVLNKLRTLGLRPLLLRRDDGILLSPDTPLVFES